LRIASTLFSSVAA
jgi:hypothetical protein